MRWVAVVLAMCGCNQVFGLQHTESVDAFREYFDAPIDAPFACPPIGTTPRFSPLLHQHITQNCRDYKISPDRQLAMALCYDDSYFLRAHEGPLDRTLVEVPDFYDVTYELQFLALGPEGDEVIGTYYAAGGYQFRTYQRLSGVWSRGPDLGTAAAYRSTSAPSRRPTRRVMQTGTDSYLHELGQGPTGAWTEVAKFSPTELGVTFPGSPSLSADGLRLLMYSSVLNGPATPRVMYTDRPSIDSSFRTAEPIESMPQVLDAYLADDCSRIYFSGLQSIFYLQQL